MWLSPAALRSLTRARDMLHSDASVKDIAAAVGMSPFHFIRTFEAVFGITPHQARIRSRLDRAKHLLALDRSVTEVCMEVGFTSLGTFSTTFTRRTGETPSGYQRRVRALVQVVGSLGPALMPGCYSLMAHLPPDAFAISKKQRAPGSATLRPQ